MDTDFAHSVDFYVVERHGSESSNVVPIPCLGGHEFRCWCVVECDDGVDFTLSPRLHLKCDRIAIRNSLETELRAIPKRGWRVVLCNGPQVSGGRLVRGLWRTLQRTRVSQALHLDDRPMSTTARPKRNHRVCVDLTTTHGTRSTPRSSSSLEVKDG